MSPENEKLIEQIDEWIENFETVIRDLKNTRNQIILGIKENHHE